jgi:hypothetical protein
MSNNEMSHEAIDARVDQIRMRFSPPTTKPLRVLRALRGEHWLSGSFALPYRVASPFRITL